METALLLLGALVLATAGVAWVNNRHDAKRAARAPSADEHVAAAWEDFGGEDIPDPDDPESMGGTGGTGGTGETADAVSSAAAAFDDLVTVAPVGALGSKTAVSRMAVMALRAGRNDLLPSLAARADALGSGCGEARALAVLAAAWRGDMDLARRMYAASQQAMAGCASCGAEASVKILLQEASLALEAADHDGTVTAGGAA